MAIETEIQAMGAFAPPLSRGVVKYLRDVWTVLEIKLLFVLRGWYWYIVRPLVFPLGVLFWLRVMIPDEPDLNRRVMAGAIVFGVSLSTANILAQQMLQDRFIGRVKLLITMPMSKSAYAVGLLVFALLQAAPIVMVLMACSFLVGVRLDVTWAFFPLMAAALLSVSGITLVIASYAPTVEVGGIMSNLFGVVLVMVSPVFFTMEQAPLPLQLIGWVSPMRYAADGIMKAISGQNDVLIELAILAVFAVVSMTFGLWKLTWRQQ